jgi:formate hydrogenlyase subunit 3/multisubunit Na+/H+ antiporter MnhD subunit
MAAVRQVLAATAPFGLAFSIEAFGAVFSLYALVILALTGLACMITVARSTS